MMRAFKDGQGVLTSRSLRPLLVLAFVLLTGARTATTTRGLVVSAHPEASKAGVELLRSGGNAIDAAVAVAYALSIVEPQSSGIGGGGFLVYREAATGKSQIIDYREVAPKRSTRDMFVVNGKVDRARATESIFAAAVPGMVAGFAEAQSKFGKKTLADALRPAINLAENGFEILPAFVDASLASLDLLKKNKEASHVFLKDGRPYTVGERLVQRDLAKTLRRLAKAGPTLFRTGDVARAIAAESKRQGGLLEFEDLANFRVRWREPLVGSYRGHEVITMPPPSSGGVHILQILKMLEFDRERRGRKTYWLDAADIHMLVEAMRVAYADRAEHLGDPAFWKVPVASLLDGRYLLERYLGIERATARRSEAVTAGRFESADTTHFTIMDAEGNVVSCTQTVNYLFGAGIVVPGTGILLNNEMDDFAAAPGSPNIFGLVGGEANSIQPEKIPLSSMSPTIVLSNGKVRLALGAPGGPTIITTVLQIILHVLDYGLDVDSAVSTPRVHHQWVPDELRLEPGALTPEIERELAARGHQLRHRAEPWGNATAIEVLPDGTRAGAADPRYDGAAAAE